MVDRLATLARRLQHDPEMLDQLRLADEFLERAWAEADLFDLLLTVRRGQDR